MTITVDIPGFPGTAVAMWRLEMSTQMAENLAHGLATAETAKPHDVQTPSQLGLTGHDIHLTNIGQIWASIAHWDQKGINKRLEIHLEPSVAKAISEAIYLDLAEARSYEPLTIWSRIKSTFTFSGGERGLDA